MARREPSRWIVGASARRGSVAALAARYGARRVGDLDAFVVRRSRARAFAAELRSRRAFSFAEPDFRLARRQSAGPGSLAQYNGWRNYLVPAGLAAPATGPLLAVVDSQLALDHPAFRGLPITSTSSDPPTEEHGTAVVAIAAGRDPGLGFEGVYPGARVRDFASGLTCGSASQAILDATRAGAAVINMSFGSSDPCYVMYLALMEAVGAGALPVAAAGNEFLSGNPESYPASFPHVLTVAAINPDGSPAFFSTANFGVDVAAPGIGLVAPVPTQFDTDGDADGYTIVSGTSFAAPMVAALATWIRARRPSLDGQQVADLMRLTAKDIWKRRYDTDTGYGLPQLGAALAARAPQRGPLEPNDTIALVDGSVFTRPDPPAWNGTGRRSVVGFLDQYKNPADVFRVVLPAHARVNMRLQVSVGSVRMLAFAAAARSFGARALAGTGAVTSAGAFTLNNRGRRTVIYVAMQAPSLVGDYQVTFTRLRGR